MPNKKLLVLIGLAAAALLSLIYGILTPSGSRRSLSNASPEAGASASLPSANNLIPLEKHAPQVRYTGWGRNPFAPAAASVPVASDLVLTGIAWDEKIPKAVINDQIVGIGTKIGDRKVKTIRRDSVVLTDGTEDFELRIGQQK